MGTERLQDLLEDVTAYCSAEEPVLDRWAETIRQEIQEQAALPPVRDIALSGVLEKIDALERGEASIGDVRRHVETLGVRGFREVTKVQWASLACDAAQETGEIPPELRGAVARLLPALFRSLSFGGVASKDPREDPLVKVLQDIRVHGPWVESRGFNSPAVVRNGVFGAPDGWSVGVFRQSNGSWVGQIRGIRAHTFGPSYRPNAEEAMREIDEFLCKNGDILLGEEEAVPLGGLPHFEGLFEALTGNSGEGK